MRPRYADAHLVRRRRPPRPPGRSRATTLALVDLVATALEGARWRARRPGDRGPTAGPRRRALLEGSRAACWGTRRVGSGSVAEYTAPSDGLYPRVDVLLGGGGAVGMLSARRHAVTRQLRVPRASRDPSRCAGPGLDALCTVGPVRRRRASAPPAPTSTGGRTGPRGSGDHRSLGRRGRGGLH